ncbi:MAG: hypothetical protein K2J81_09400 [Treponemataceae bacterium]|nr:hypothetical protein [Treponemataceae bacterium]
MKNVTLIVAVMLCAALFTHCKKETSQNRQPADEPSQSLPANTQRLSAEANSYLQGKHIFVLLGYGYNDEAFVEKTRAALEERYGVQSEEKDGLIMIAVYPDDFMRGSTARISLLTTAVEDTELAGIILLGAPESTHRSLAKLQDKNGGEYPYPVYSFFPQDDVLGSESTADFVLDYAQKTDLLQAEEQLESDFDADNLLANAIETMLNPQEPIPTDSDLRSFVQKLVGSGRTIRPYTDGETGLQAQNHFIFE